MTIQSVNLTVPGGDTPRSAFTKINNNFNNNSHAASRLVGTANGNVVEMTSEGVAGTGWGSSAKSITGLEDIELITKSGLYAGKLEGEIPNVAWHTILSLPSQSLNYGHYLTFRTGVGTIKEIEWTRYWREGIEFTVSIYHTGNTTTDSNGFIKAASPIVKVHDDKVVLNSDAEHQNITFKRNGVGDYTITTQSGLSTDGWYIELPKDLNGNPKVAVTLEETDGVISLKSYVRVFSMQTFTFEPDLSQPLDIPEGRWIDLRLHELPIDDVPA